MDKRETVTIEKLLKVITPFMKKKELEQIKKAYKYAVEFYGDMTRHSGETYLEHSLVVAYILASIKADSETIAAGLIHEIFDVENVTDEMIEKEFGASVKNLILGVSKLNKLNFSLESDAAIANQRKILVGLSEDVRVIIIKLADRLHSMRRLYSLPQEMQKQKAKETLDILIPIAHRLGMNEIKSELEDLSLRYLKPDIYFSIVESLNKTKKERNYLVEEMISEVKEILKKNKISAEIKGRAKSIYSIYKKLDAGKKFDDIFDLLALRIYVNKESECYNALGLIHAKYKPVPKRFKDYIASPKTNRYQSLHTSVFGTDSNIFEIQIRTYEMDKVAEKGIASHWSYKEKNKKTLQSTLEDKLQFFRNIIELQTENLDDESFVQSVKNDILEDTIYVYTPNGDVLELPKGATPIDFAYKVHTNVGNKMTGALVNGTIVPLDHELQTNDIVKVSTNNNSQGPSKEWMNIVKTSHARNKIKAYYSKINREEVTKSGEDIILKEVKRRKIPLLDFKKDEHKILEAYKLPNTEELYFAIGSGRFLPNQVLNTIYTHQKTKEEIILEKVKSNEISKKSLKNDILVHGLAEIKVQTASCCNPIPGDKIIGYIKKGAGVSVHRIHCPNVKDLEERLIEVSWNEEKEKKYNTSISVKSKKIDGMLLKIISKTKDQDITIEKFLQNSKNEEITIELIVSVKNTEVLSKFINSIRQIKGILEVERLIK